MVGKLFSLLFAIFIVISSNAQVEGDFTIGLTTASFEPAKNEQEEINDRLKINSHPVNGKSFKIIQVFNIPDQTTRSVWYSEGMELLEYIPNKAYFVSLSSNVNITNTSLIRSVIEIDARFKVESSLFHNGIPEYAVDNEGNTSFVISYFDRLPVESILADLSNEGTIIGHRAYSRQVDIKIKNHDLEWLVSLPYIQFIGVRDPDPTLEVPFWRGTGRANYLDSGFNGLNFSGSGVTIGIGEGGVLNSNAIDYKGRLTEMNSGTSGHKLGVGLRAAGGGNSNPADRGVAYGSDVLSVSGSPSYGNLYNSNGLRFTNHSLGYGISGSYSQSARNFDLYVEDFPAGMVHYSAGNSGNSTGFSPYNSFSGYGNLTGTRKQFKNNILAASLGSTDGLIGFSSKGPTYDGRLAPHLALEGSGGTSHSAPKMVGSFAVLSEVYTSYNPGMEAPSSLIKAICMNTADDIGIEGIDFRTGYGRVNLRRAHDLIQSDQIITDAITDGATNVHNINVPANTHQLRVLVYWRDEAAVVNAAIALVNDIDLEVENPSNTVTLPWVLNHAADPMTLDDPPTRQVDHLNNVEQVTIENPAAGIFEASISGFNIPSGPQEYFLVYEFLQEEITITDPIKNQKLVPGENHVIYWDAYTDSSDDFLLEYKIENGSWQNIATVNSDTRATNWTVPDPGNGIFNVELRISQGAISNQTDTNTIGKIVQNISVVQNCQDTLYLTWDAIPGATSYNLYLLEDKFMTHQVANATVAGNTGNIGGIDNMEEVYFAVSAVTNGKEGRKSNAQNSTYQIEFPQSISFDNINVDGCSMGGPKSYNLQFCAEGMMTLIASKGFELSLTEVSGYNDTLIITPTGIGIDTEIFVRLDPAFGFGIGKWAGSISHQVGGLESMLPIDPFIISCAGEVSSNAIQGFESGEVLTIEGLNWNNPTNFTIEWWMNPTSYNNYNQQIGNGWGNFLFHTNNNGGVSAGVSNNASRINSANGLLELNKWQHFAFVKNGTFFTFYHNGTLIGTSTSSSNVNWTNFNIGQTGGNSINGMIDEFRMWDIAKSESDIRENMHLTSLGNEIGLKVYLQFNAEAGNVVDYSPNCYNVANNGFNFQTSTAPVAKGISVTKNIKDSEFYSFDNGELDTDVDITYTTPPDGDIVVSYLKGEGPQGSIPSLNLAANHSYWIIHNYGTAIPPLGVDITFTLDSLSAEETATDIALTQRDHNDLGLWQTLGNPDAIDNNLNSVSYNQLDDVSQFLISLPVQVDSFPGNMATLPGGGGNHINLNPLNLNSNTITMSTWFKPEGQQNDWAGLIYTRDGNSTAGINILSNNELRYTWNGDNWEWESGAFVNLNEWNHLALVVGPSQTIIYLNGVPYTHNVSNSAEEFNGILRIGSDALDNTRTFKGDIDEVLIWDRELTQDEVRHMRHLTQESLVENDPSLVLYHQFNSPYNISNDVSGNGHTATYSGTVSNIKSDAPVGGGSSSKVIVSGLGEYGSEQGVQLNFGAGTTPNGELFMTKLNNSPNTIPNNDATTSGYWIVNNYGLNMQFTGLEALLISEANHFAHNSDLSNLNLYYRPENGHLADWSLIDQADSLNVKNGINSFYQNFSLEQTGQFLLSNSAGMNWVGVKNDDWEEPYNWSKVLVPAITDEAIINGKALYQPILDLDVEIKSLILQPGARIIILPGVALDLME